MDKHNCKLCFRSFSNGRALGGHMRSHMLSLPIPPKPAPPPSPAAHPHRPTETASSSVYFSNDESTPEEEMAAEKGMLYYGLRENPRKSFRVADPEFSFAAVAAATAASSVVVQDRESETESSKNQSHRGRSKQPRSKPSRSIQRQYDGAKLKHPPWGAEAEPASSISDAATEEDVALCLMLLSRDRWSRKRNRVLEPESEGEEEEEEEDEEVKTEEGFDSDDFQLCKPKSSKGKYRCETCQRWFKSYQALGGHRASHKKLNPCNNSAANHNDDAGFSLRKPENVDDDRAPASTRSHECPVCFRVFSSGQALGGHKRSHLLHQTRISAAASAVKIPCSGAGRCGDNLNLIDLNQPAPLEEDPEFEFSAVSDAEFVNPSKS